MPDLRAIAARLLAEVRDAAHPATAEDVAELLRRELGPWLPIRWGTPGAMEAPPLRTELDGMVNAMRNAAKYEQARKQQDGKL